MYPLKIERNVLTWKCTCILRCGDGSVAKFKEEELDLLGTLPVTNGQCCKTNEDTFDDNC